jgi:signal transduction histidine kinase
MREKMSASLGLRLISTMIVIIMIVVAAYSLYAVNRGRNRAYQSLATKGDLLARHLAFNARLAVFAENSGMLKSLAEAVVNEPDVVLVGIYNADLKPLYLVEKQPSKAGQESQEAVRQALIAQSEKEKRPGRGEQAMGFAKPVVMLQYANPGQSVYFGDQAAEVPERTIGYVRVVFSLESLNRELRGVYARNAMLAFLFIGISSAGVYVWVKKAVKPLETLTQQVRALGEGSRVEEVHASSRDEIGRLAEAFNTMLEERKKAEQALEKVLMDIHDGIGGITTNISMLSEVARQASSPEESARALKTIADLARDGMVEVRGLMYSLDREDLNWRTFTAELRSHGTRYLKPHGIEFRMIAEVGDDAPRPTSYLCLNLFRICREAVMNVIKHANAEKVSIHLRVDRKRLVLTVQDDGQGCPSELFNGHGRGVSNMMSRTREMNGTCVIRGEAGTCVVVEVPLEPGSPAI